MSSPRVYRTKRRRIHYLAELRGPEPDNPEHPSIQCQYRGGNGCRAIIPLTEDLCPYHRVMKIVRRKLEKFKRPGTLTFAKVASIYAARWAVKLVEETRMTILVYCHATGKFYYHFQAGNQAAVNARSGPWGKGSAPAGSYTVERPVAIEPTVENSPYTDAQGFAWFARIVPRFQTERYGFGIHPDGNVPGTRGCIGIAVGDTKPVFDFLKQAAEPIVLVVVR